MEPTEPIEPATAAEVPKADGPKKTNKNPRVVHLADEELPPVPIEHNNCGKPIFAGPAAGDLCAGDK